MKTIKNQAKKNFRNLSRFVGREEGFTAKEKLDILFILGAAINLGALIKTEVAPELAAMRRAELYASAGPKSLLENSPELYNRKTKSLEIHRFYAPGQTADVEISESQRIFTHAAGRHESPEMPLK